MAENYNCKFPGCDKKQSCYGLELQLDGKKENLYFCCDEHRKEFLAIKKYSDAIYRAWKLRKGEKI